MLDNHAPYKRIISDEATAADRQWLKMLKEQFKDVRHEDLVVAGMDMKAATEVLGLIAIDDR